MTTSATLSVGIKTDSAKQSLRELKAYMQREMRGVVLSLNEDSIRKSLQDALSKAKFRIGIDTTRLRGDVTETLNQAFSAVHTVRINAEALAAQVHTAIAAGMGGATVAGSGMPVDVRSLINQHLAPLAEEIGRVTATVRGGTVAAVGAAAAAGAGRRSARASRSAIDEETGERLSFTRNISDAHVVETEKKIRAIQRQTEAGKELLRDQELMHKLSSLERKEREVITALRFKQAQAAAPDARQLLNLQQEPALLASGRFGGGSGRVPLTTFGTSLKAVMEAEAREAAAAAAAVSKLEQAHTRARVAASRSASDHRHVKFALDDAHSAARGLAGSLGVLWVTWGSTAPIVAAAAIGGALRSVFVHGKDVEHQLRFVAALSGDLVVPMDKFATAVRGALTPPVEAAQAMRAMAQNGLNVRESLAALPSILNLATAGEMGLTEAALGATGVMAAFNLQVSDLGRVGDVFAKAAAVSNTSVQGMVEAMRQASTVGDLYHASLEETAASLATMAKRNIQGTAAGTAFRNMLVELAAPSEKARRAMQALGLQVFDANDKLKPFTEILRLVKERTDSLTEKSKLEFLGAIFNERGSKAINALLADYQTFGETLETLEKKSKDFTRTIVEALSETTQGKVKQAITEFQLTASEAFGSAKASADLFVDSLRSLFASPEFKAGIANLASNLASLSTGILKHADAIAYGALAWASYRAATGLAAAALLKWAGTAEAARVATAAAAFTVGGLSVSLGAVLSAVTLGLSVIIPFVLQWVLLRKHTDEATEAQRAFNESLVNQNRTMEDNIQRLRDENGYLSRRNDLLRQGFSLKQAEAAAGGSAGVAASKNALESQGRLLDAAQARFDELQARIEGDDRRLGDVRELQGAAEYLNEVRAGYDAAKKAYELVKKQQDLNDANRVKEELKNRIEQAKEFNREVTALAAKQPKLNLSKLFLSISDAESNDATTFSELLSERRAELNKNKTNLELPNSENRRDALAKSRQLIEQLRGEAEVMKQTARHARELDQARYSEDLYGPYISALLTEQRTLRENRDLLQLEQEAVARLNAEKARGQAAGYTKADLTNLETEIIKRQQAITLMKKQIDHEVALQTLKSQNRARKDTSQFDDELRKLSVSDVKDLQGIREKFAVKVVPSAEAAAMNAELVVTQRYAESISRHEADIVRANEGVLVLKRAIAEAGEGYLSDDVALLSVAEANLATEQKRLDVVRQRMTDARVAARLTARVEYEAAQTAQSGWDQFWAQYRDNATSSAKLVGDVMKSTTDKMQEGFANFVVTGKLNFKSLMASIAADAARLMAQRAFQQVFLAAFNFIGGQGFGSGAAFGNQDLGINFADGGVMTPYGMAPLHRYSRGGVAYSPQVAIYGEGRRPEAYVPLPDGRTIPVTIQGGGTGGDTNVNTQVYVQSDGSTRVENDVSGEKAAVLGKLIEQATMGVIAREKRPGGLLYAMN